MTIGLKATKRVESPMQLVSNIASRHQLGAAFLTVLRVVSGSGLIIVSLVPLLRVAHSLWLFRQPLSPMVEGCSSLACVRDLEVREGVFSTWIAPHGFRLRAPRVLLVDVASTIALLFGLIFVGSMARLWVIVVVLSTYVGLLFWQVIHFDVIRNATLIFD